MVSAQAILLSLALSFPSGVHAIPLQTGPGNVPLKELGVCHCPFSNCSKLDLGFSLLDLCACELALAMECSVRASRKMVNCPIPILPRCSLLPDRVVDDIAGGNATLYIKGLLGHQPLENGQAASIVINAEAAAAANQQGTNNRAQGEEGGVAISPEEEAKAAHLFSAAAAFASFSDKNDNDDSVDIGANSTSDSSGGKSAVDDQPPTIQGPALAPSAEAPVAEGAVVTPPLVPPTGVPVVQEAGSTSPQVPLTEAPVVQEAGSTSPQVPLTEAPVVQDAGVGTSPIIPAAGASVAQDVGVGTSPQVSLTEAPSVQNAGVAISSQVASTEDTVTHNAGVETAVQVPSTEDTVTQNAGVETAAQVPPTEDTVVHTVVQDVGAGVPSQVPSTEVKVVQSGGESPTQIPPPDSSTGFRIGRSKRNDFLPLLINKVRAMSPAPHAQSSPPQIQKVVKAILNSKLNSAMKIHHRDLSSSTALKPNCNSNNGPVNPSEQLSQAIPSSALQTSTSYDFLPQNSAILAPVRAQAIPDLESQVIPPSMSLDPSSLLASTHDRNLAGSAVVLPYLTASNVPLIAQPSQTVPFPPQVSGVDDIFPDFSNVGSPSDPTFSDLSFLESAVGPVQSAVRIVDLPSQAPISTPHMDSTGRFKSSKSSFLNSSTSTRPSDTGSAVFPVETSQPTEFLSFDSAVVRPSSSPTMFEMEMPADGGMDSFNSAMVFLPSNFTSLATTLAITTKSKPTKAKHTKSKPTIAPGESGETGVHRNVNLNTTSTHRKHKHHHHTRLTSQPTTTQSDYPVMPDFNSAIMLDFNSVVARPVDYSTPMSDYSPMSAYPDFSSGIYPGLNSAPAYTDSSTSVPQSFNTVARPVKTPTTAFPDFSSASFPDFNSAPPIPNASGDVRSQGAGCNNPVQTSR